MGRHFYCVHGDSQTQTTSQIHTIYIYTVFMYIQCKQWLNILCGCQGCIGWTISTSSGWPRGPRNPLRTKKPKKICGKRWDVIIFIHVFYVFLSLFGVFFFCLLGGFYQSVSPILTDSAVMGWPSRDSSLVIGWTYCGWLRNPAPHRATIEIRGMFIIYELVQDFAITHNISIKKT